MKRRLLLFSAVILFACMSSCDDQFSEVEQTSEEVMVSPSSGDDDGDEDEGPTPTQHAKTGTGG